MHSRYFFSHISRNSSHLIAIYGMYTYDKKIQKHNETRKKDI